MSRILITGSARGIGLQLTRQYLAAGHEVIAVCRAPGAMLPTTAAECIEGIELTRSADLDRLLATVGERRIDVLIHNAGMLQRESLGGLREAAEGLRCQFETNTLAPLLLTEALLPNLGSGSKMHSSPVAWARSATTVPVVTMAIGCPRAR